MKVVFFILTALLALDSRAEVYCSAGCLDALGMVVDNRTLDGGIGRTLLEAQTLAKQNVQQRFKCRYGVATKSCERPSAEAAPFCVVSCTDALGFPDQRFSGSGRGASIPQAEVEAVRDLQTRYRCRFGIVRIACE